MGEFAERDRLAAKVVDLARALVLADNHFLSAAIGRLSPMPGNFAMPFATDGSSLGIDSDKVLEAFAHVEEPPQRDFLHTVLHCVFLHPFVGANVDGRLWSLACDIAVERVVADACGARSGQRGEEIGQALDIVAERLGGRCGAEKVYRALRGGSWADEVSRWEPLFRADDHVLWHPVREGDADGDCNMVGVVWNRALRSERDSDETMREARESWRKVAKSLAVDLRSYSKERGRELVNLVSDLEDAARERVDYAEFLRQFATPGEVLKVSDDEFDYVFYTYGLRLYGNLPLVEPLEYREQKRVREFVLVIDTSGSVWGDIVKRFVSTTFDVLKSTEAFFERVHVRIIQCDYSVRSDDVIENLDQLEAWRRTMQLRGGGGTDFRPAFGYVDKLVDEGTFENLGGLVYFTDGRGAYPEWMPGYKTAFVFYDDGYRAEDVPPWAAQIVLDEAGIEGGWQ